MPLINCPECQNSVSDSAINCPKCGYPIKDNISTSHNPQNSQSQNPIPKKPIQQNQNKGCGTVLIIFIGLLFFLFIWKKCSNNNSESLTTSPTIDSLSIAEEDSLNKKVTITVNGKKLETTVRNRVADSIFIVKEEKFKNSKAGRIQKKHPEWTQEECENIANNRIWIGMKYEMLVYMRGKPDNVNTSNYGNGQTYQACWHDYDPSCFYFDEDQIIKSYN